MRLLCFAVIRLAVITALLMTAAAVVAGRYSPRPAEQGGPAVARGERAFHQAINRNQDARSLNVLDTRTGVLEQLRAPGAGYLRFASCSPWRDAVGRTQLVAQWHGRDESTGWGVGLLRVGMPGGNVLDRVAMDVIPRGSPCWFPDGSARVVFSASNGRLYQFAFEGKGEEPEAAHARAPVPLAWRPGIPLRRLNIIDPTWPFHPQFADILLVTFIELAELGAARSHWPPPRLWWLRIDPRTMDVVAAGRLIEPDPWSPEDVDGEFLGNVAVMPDGKGLALAYLVRSAANQEFRLRLALLSIDPAARVPRASEADSVELARSRAYTTPVFSPDGRWVYSLPRDPATPERATRSSVPSALAGRVKPRDSQEPSYLAARTLTPRRPAATLP